jgi:hypothetical protein
MLTLFVVIFLAIVAALAYRSYRPAPQLRLNAKWRLSRAFLLGFVPSVIVFIGVNTVDGWWNVSHTFHESPFTALGMLSCGQSSCRSTCLRGDSTSACL